MVGSVVNVRWLFTSNASMQGGGCSAHLAVAAPVGKFVHLERLRALDEVGQVKVADVVANDDVRIRLYHQVPPSLQHTASLSVNIQRMPKWGAWIVPEDCFWKVLKIGQ